VDRSLLRLAEGDLYRPHSSVPQYMLWIAAVGVVVLTIVGFHLWNSNRRPRDRRGEEASPEDILAELCRVHELTRLEQTLVVKIARDQHLPQPAALFIDPDPLDRACDGPDLDTHVCRALRHKLFGAVD
jgi:hypothetical protein